MHTTIWKFSLLATDDQTVEVPVNARPLAVQIQRDKFMEVPTLWCLVDPKAEKQTTRICMVGTGHLIEPSILATMEYLGTIQLMGDQLVLHVFGSFPKT